MSAMPDSSAEAAILEFLCDEDGDVDVNAALNVLLNVAGGLCLLDPSPDAPAETFADELRSRVARRIRARLQS